MIQVGLALVPCEMRFHFHTELGLVLEIALRVDCGAFPLLEGHCRIGFGSTVRNLNEARGFVAVKGRKFRRPEAVEI